MKSLMLAAVATSALGFAAVAAPASAADVEIRHAVARVVVIPEDRSDIAVEIEPGRANLPALTVRRRGGEVRIDGELGRNAIGDCSDEREGARLPGEGASVDVRGRGRIALADAPLVVVRTPRAVDINADDGAFGSIGRGASSIELGSGGCGAWTVANTTGRMLLAVGGSGSIRAGSSGELKAAVGGSGSIMAGPTGRLDGAIGGSGDITVARISGGQAKIAIGGSGDVLIREGDTPNLNVAIGGSGDVTYGGRAGTASVSIAGSGDVRVREVTGEVRRAVVGSGTVTIGR
ncbi:hypothetical protein ASG17_08520 [Brevundimonas sp. Leaf363]|uniref:GIN domain-containing protein n=1 Tax=Brevundimonas sp. Leaf363 TaxID=1736353 RepID=UPI0006F3C02D|nr:DUF2807 domain-containing protein [Brevundimonas sp. Leaf363]KQS56070.1 hypothetical protein ASG17_08520 [Brevundimonas sp. Leaf363]